MSFRVISFDEYLNDKQKMSAPDRDFWKLVSQRPTEEEEEKKTINEEDLKEFVATLKNIIITK